MRRGAVTREDIEADSSSMLPVWQLLRPFLEEWITSHPTLDDWQRELARGVMDYEEQRLRFVNVNDGPLKEGMDVYGENWDAFVSNVDIANIIFEAMQTNQSLTPGLVKEWGIVLVRQELNSYRAYTTEIARLPDLRLHPLLLSTRLSQ